MQKTTVWIIHEIVRIGYYTLCIIEFKHGILNLANGDFHRKWTSRIWRKTNYKNINKKIKWGKVDFDCQHWFCDFTSYSWFTTQDILLHVNIKSISQVNILCSFPHTEQCVCVHLKCDLHHNCTTVVIYYAILCFCHAAAASYWTLTTDISTVRV